jgi:two-component system, NtrC family, response regulator HydG
MTEALRILVLDDHVEVAESLGEILELIGHEVQLVHNGADAVDAYLAGAFDIGLFDVKMPGMNGVESFLAIKRQRPDAKIFMMSGYADDELIEKAIDSGALGLLRKPFEPDELIAKVDALVKSGIATAAGMTAA